MAIHSLLRISHFSFQTLHLALLNLQSTIQNSAVYPLLQFIPRVNCTMKSHVGMSSLERGKCVERDIITYSSQRNTKSVSFMTLILRQVKSSQTYNSQADIPFPTYIYLKYVARQQKPEVVGAVNLVECSIFVLGVRY